MFFGTIILGKLSISNKWRKNEQPNYARACTRGKKKLSNLPASCRYIAITPVAFRVQTVSKLGAIFFFFLLNIIGKGPAFNYCFHLISIDIFWYSLRGKT